VSDGYRNDDAVDGARSRSLVALAVGLIAPAMIGTTNGIAVDMIAFANDIGGRVDGKMGAHMRAIGFQHDHPAAFPAV
jgi:hypothetical protein